MKKVLILLAVAVSVLACDKCDKPEIREVNYQLISDDALYGAGEEQIEKGNLIITTENAWNDLKSKMNAVNQETDDFDNVPVDFSKEMVIACFDEVREHSGYDIFINYVIEETDNLIIDVEKTVVDEETIVMTAIQQPYYIIKMSKLDKRIVFE